MKPRNKHKQATVNSTLNLIETSWFYLKKKKAKRKKQIQSNPVLSLCHFYKFFFKRNVL